MTEKIKVVFLGTSSSIPTISRNHPAILLSYGSEKILIDCGEGTQRQFRKAKFSPAKVTRLLITHWHGDHVLGIPGFLQTLSLNNYKKTLEIYGPTGTKKFMKTLLKTFVFSGEVKTKITEISAGKFIDEKEFYIEAKKLYHGTPTFAYNFVIKGQRKIDKKKLEKTKIPSGPLLKKLKQGKDITYKGKKYLAKNLTYNSEAKKISIVMDTSFDKSIANFVKKADIFVCESSFGNDMASKARNYKHLTAQQAAQIAKKAKVKRLILTHLSQRYDKDPKKILTEARKVFKNSSIARDLQDIRI